MDTQAYAYVCYIHHNAEIKQFLMNHSTYTNSITYTNLYNLYYSNDRVWEDFILYNMIHVMFRVRRI